jgi:Pretoxin HINT domain
MSVSTRTPRQASRSPRAWLAPAVALGLILLGSYLIRGASRHPERNERQGAATRSASSAAAAAPLRTRSIEAIRVGDRVRADGPATALGANPGVADSGGSASAADAEEVDPATWRRIELVTADAAGGRLEITLLRPSAWVQDVGAVPGRQVPLIMPEMGLDGLAQVVAVRSCPPIQPGPGRVVTGTFVHDNVPVLDLRVAGSAAPLGVTPGHAIWSEDRQAFVLAGELKVGERLHLLTGTTRVESLMRRTGRHRVYNLEVQCVHVYHVTDRGLLVHNNSVVSLWKAPAPGRNAAGEVVNGYEPTEYPGDGPYFATRRSIAESFQDSYENGLQEIRIPKARFEQLVAEGVIQPDGYYAPGQSWHVPSERLPAFNQAIMEGPPNLYHTQ